MVEQGPQEVNLSIVYFGNPIMDIQVEDRERAIMNKYSLELGMTTLASPETMPLYDEIWARADKLTIPGGAALNSARASKHANK